MSNMKNRCRVYLLLGLFLLISCSKTINTQNDKCSFDELREVGIQLKDAIVAKDIKTIIYYSADRITLEADDSVSKEELNELFNDSQSLIYLKFFDTEGLQKIYSDMSSKGVSAEGDYYSYTFKDAKSIRDYFINAGDKISVKTNKAFINDWPPKYGAVIYEFYGKPKGSSMFADPLFVCGDHGWRLIYLFTEG